ncbi:hypothetical protein TWF132_002473 [Orbilia oligospora]|nr:hypothetical protein TWF132_002473 [Orbilia oligospora]
MHPLRQADEFTCCFVLVYAYQSQKLAHKEYITISLYTTTSHVAIATRVLSIRLRTSEKVDRYPAGQSESEEAWLNNLIPNVGIWLRSVGSSQFHVPKRGRNLVYRYLQHAT